MSDGADLTGLDMDDVSRAPRSPLASVGRAIVRELDRVQRTIAAARP